MDSPKRAAFILLFWLAAAARISAVTFEDWQTANFTASELADPSVSGEVANPAGDGLCNLLKYAFDLDPRAPAIEGAPAAQFFGGALALNFLHRSDADDLDYALEASSDLFHWSLPNGLSLAATLPLEDIEQWTALNPYPWPTDLPQFLRLRVTRSAAPLLLDEPPQMVRVRTVSPPLGLEIHWTDRSNVELGYRIERQRAAEGWELFGITGPDTIFYPDHTVQSGIAYAYRVRALFDGDQFSDWSESGGATPAPPGGGGGTGDPGPPDPDPDTDEDTYKNSVDAYPHDNRRSRDIPTLTYAEIDISTPVIGANDVIKVALDDQNQVAFSYVDDPSDYQPESLHVVLWKDGAQVGETITHSLIDPDWEISPYWGYLNASGEIAGTAFRADFLEPEPQYPGFVYIAYTMSPGASEPTFIPEIEGEEINNDGWGWLDGLKNSGLIWGSGFLSYIGDELIDGSPILVNETGKAVSGSIYSSGGPYSRWDGSASHALDAQRVFALSDNGTIFGVTSGTPPDTGLPTGSLSAKLWSVTDGTAQEGTTLLPSEFRKQIAFNENTTAEMNSAGDILFTTKTLEGPEDAPVWNWKTILWNRQATTLFTPNGTLAQIPNPGQQLNTHGLMVDTDVRYPLDPDTGEEDPTQDPYLAAILKVPVEFVTKGPNGEFLPQSVTWNSVVPPQIEVTAASAAYAANALTVSVSGKVTDATSDCTPTPGKQVATLFVSGGAAEAQIALTNTATPEAADPWRPYKYEAQFTQNVMIPITGPGDYAVRLRTSENAGGLAGTQEVNIHVLPNDLTQDVQLQLPASFSATDADAITMTLGVAPSTETVTLTETGPATHIFAGPYGPATITLTFAQPPMLTAAVDTLSATLAKSFASQTVSSVSLSLIENGETTNAFAVVPPANPSYQVSTSTGGTAHPGNFFPTIVRFPAGVGQSLITAGYKISIMEHDWSLKLKTYEGEEYAYVVDDNDKPVVFNPSLYAQTDIQTKKLVDGKFPLTIKGANGEKIWGKDEILSVARGLLIYGATGATAKDYLNSKLTHLAKAIHPRVQGRAEGAYLYSPEKGEVLGHVDNEIETEIVWRYVNTKDTVVIFNSYQEMRNDIAYRKEICNLAKTKIDPGFGDDVRANKTKWKSGDLVGVQFGPADGVSWSAALNDVFAGGVEGGAPTYQIGCKNTVHCLHLLAFVNNFGEPVLIKRIAETPGGVLDPKFLANYTTVNWTFPSANKISRDDDYRQSWIPGDLGYIDNTSIPDSDSANTGEHILYVGGSFDLDYASFKDNAQFFGHRFHEPLIDGQLPPFPNIVSLAAWILKIDGLPGSEHIADDAKLDPFQRVLRQPFTK